MGTGGIRVLESEGRGSAAVGGKAPRHSPPRGYLHRHSTTAPAGAAGDQAPGW